MRVPQTDGLVEGCLAFWSDAFFARICLTRPKVLPVISAGVKFCMPAHGRARERGAW